MKQCHWFLGQRLGVEQAVPLRNLKEPYSLQYPKANDKRCSTDRKPQLPYYLATSKAPGHEGNPPRRIPEKLLKNYRCTVRRVIYTALS